MGYIKITKDILNSVTRYIYVLKLTPSRQTITHLMIKSVR